MSSIYRLIFVVAFTLILTGCANIFAGMYDPESDDARFYEAMQLLDDRDFANAISYFEQMSAGFLANTEVRRGYASALAGQCGMEFITFFNTISSGQTDTNGLFQLFMSGFVGRAVIPESCHAADTQMRLIGALPTDRTADDNLFVAILSIAKMGAFVRARADQDGPNSLGDGTVDTGFNACVSTDPGNVGYFSDDDIKMLISGLAALLENITVLAATLSQVSEALVAVEEFNTTCASLPENPCHRTNPDDITDGEIYIFRALLSTTDMGFGTCTDQSLLTCCIVPVVP